MRAERISGGARPSGIKKLHEHLKETMIEGTFAAFVLFDIDALQRINAKHGRKAGDRLLSSVEDYFRTRGLVGYRIGGGEFGVVIEGRVTEFAPEEFRRELHAWLCERTGFQVSFSGGGVRHPGDEFLLVPRMADLIFSAAHQLLVKARQQGHDRVLWLPRDPVDSVDIMKIMVRFYEELARIHASLARELEIESRIDFLTGLANRRGFEDAFGRMIESAQRRNNPLALIYMDSDSLKRINDTKGHDAGDRFLTDIARVLKQVVRGSDFISRWGADEFAVLMDSASREKAMTLADRIHRAIEERTEGTVSIGVYCGVPRSAEEAVQKADQALYRAKEEGKNRVEFAS